MKIFFPFFLLTAVCVAATAQIPTHLQLAGYEMTWCDDFSGDCLNRDYWNVEVNGTGCGNNELQFYIDSLATVCVEDGNLVLTATRTPYGNHEFISGRVNTKDKFTFKYGLVEASIKLPKTANGLWPAFWMMGNDITSNSWPLCGETDILEMGHFDGINASTQDRLFNGAVHCGTTSKSHRQQVGAYTSPYSLQDGKYHKFYVLWTSQSIQMYVDDNEEPYFVVDITDRDSENGTGYFFQKPFFFLFNLAVGGNFPDINTADDVTALQNGSASMYVDYVRVYQPSAPRVEPSRNNELQYSEYNEPHNH